MHIDFHDFQAPLLTEGERLNIQYQVLPPLCFLI